MRLAALITTLSLLSTAAAAQQVTYDYDRGTDFARFKTYAWVDGTILQDEFNHRRIVAAVDSQLKLKGFTRVERGANPDVLVAYHASFDKDLRITGFSSGWAGYRFAASRSGTARVDDVVTGTLVVDMVEAASKTIIWRGTARKEVDAAASPEKREKNIHKAAEKLYRNYPPRKG